jgi:hypothetical protein
MYEYVRPSTENASTLYDSDAAAGRRLDGSESFAHLYRRFAEYNRGIRLSRTRSDQSILTREDSLTDFKTIASRLELTNFQKQRALFTFRKLDLSKLSTPNGIDARIVAFVVASLVCEDDGRHYHPNRGSNDALFTAVASDLGLIDRPHLARSAFAKIAAEVDL